MADSRFLIIRMGSLGDIVHTLPAVHALAATFPQARIDWLVETKWMPLLEGNPDLSAVIALDRRSLGKTVATVGQLWKNRYTIAIDFQGLYKSALIARVCGAGRRIGLAKEFAREPAASWLYTSVVKPSGRHIVEQNLSLAEHAGARRDEIRFPIPRDEQPEVRMAEQLTANQLTDFFVLSPGGGWRSKCWPPERFGELHQRIREQLGWRGVISYGPGEEGLARELCAAAGNSHPVPLAMNLRELVAVLRRARFVVAADTGPLHLAAAMGAPVVGLYGPTDPARNGPYPENVVVTNARSADITYKRGSGYSPAMLSITVEQVMAAIRKRMEIN